ncbi:MAG: hypothetical protein NTX53_21160 [candidate division WOR-3 bacterium]|nr:hypothetical protein [candidate division WOR-3 bacterium]
MRIGLIVEGEIDEEVIPPLLDQLHREAAPLYNQQLEFRQMPYQPNGAGEVPKQLEYLIYLHTNSPSEWQRLGCDTIVVVIDSLRTDAVQDEIRDVLRGASGFPAVYGLAIQETEAWVLGDIEYLNKHVFKVDPAPNLPAKPEKDPDPKRTLSSMFVAASPVIEYDCWNRECARLVAGYLRHAQVATNCPKGFGKLAKKFTQVARRARTTRARN